MKPATVLPHRRPRGALKSFPRPRRRVRKIALWTLAGIVGLALLVRFVGSPFATAAVNRRLAELPGYSGHVGSVQLALWRGRITATEFVLNRTDQEVVPPALQVGLASLRIAPLALLRGEIRGVLELDDVTLVVVPRPKTASKEKSNEGEIRADRSRTWQSILDQDFPIHVTRLEVSNLTVKFADPGRALAPQVIIENARLVAHDFTAQPTPTDDFPSKLRLEGEFPGGGMLVVDASGDSTAASPAFHATMAIKALSLAALHDLIEACAHVDVRRGRFDLAVEVTAWDRHYDGFVRPFLRDLEYKTVPDPRKNIVTNIAVEVAGAAQDLLKSGATRPAKEIPFRGDLSVTEVDLWLTVENLLRNAVITTLREGFQEQKQSG